MTTREDHTGRALCAPDKFSSSATAPEIATAMGRGARKVSWRAEELALSDGGEGFAALFSGIERRDTVTGPLGEPVEATWWWVEDDPDGPLAAIEMAAASGLVLAGGPEHNDPLGATTTGTGELVLAAVRAGARRIVVGCGGSATTDGGAGALGAIGDEARLADCELLVAYDTTTTFLEAPERFGAQKGATPAMVGELRTRLTSLAAHYESRYSIDVTPLPGSGAAGGLAGGLAAIGGRLVSGFDLIAERTGLAEALARADLVITGEGRVDATSFSGKVVGRLLELADTPVLVVAGQVEDDVVAPRGVEIVSLTATYDEKRSFAEVTALVEEVVAANLAGRSPGE